MFSKLVPFCTAHRNDIIHLFQLGYLLGFLFLVFSAWVMFAQNSLMGITFELGKNLGQLSALLFLVVTLPGIFGRFGFKHPLITVGIMFRRHTGISMFLTGLAHGLIVYAFPQLAAGSALLPMLLYETVGLLTLVLLLPLFLTSNLYSMQHMGKNWKRVHKVIYLAFWLIALHTALAGERTFTLIVSLAGIMEIASLLYERFKPKPVPQTPVVPPTPASA